MKGRSAHVNGAHIVWVYLDVSFHPAQGSAASLAGFLQMTQTR